MEQKSFLRKIWWFIWEDNSIWSWIVNIILAFVIIKFLIYPGLGFMLGTTHPVVAVVSSSMEHPGGFDYWFENKESCFSDSLHTKPISQEDILFKFGITGEDFETFAFKNGFNKGDIIVLVEPKELKVGDVLVFQTTQKPDPIIHRIINVKQLNGGDKKYRTKGDNNCDSSGFEKAVTKDKMIGKALFRVPFLGWLKIGFVNLLKGIGIAG